MSISRIITAAVAVLVLAACKPGVNEGDYKLGSDYILSIESSKGIFITDMREGREVRPTVFEVGWSEKYIIAKSTNSSANLPQLWFINKSERTINGPFSEEEFAKEKQKTPELQLIKLKSVADLRAR